ncbi:hypothetical protein [Nocardia sp. AG03]|uniref:hypothetical protein n=1 Tax=Nocardia sp. AG03 TaxID=3025312 RepID=UPI002418B57C|nr:hypothetical protein [Nocardia sp. AG03]
MQLLQVQSGVGARGELGENIAHIALHRRFQRAEVEQEVLVDHQFRHLAPSGKSDSLDARAPAQRTGQG